MDGVLSKLAQYSISTPMLFDRRSSHRLADVRFSCGGRRRYTEPSSCLFHYQWIASPPARHDSDSRDRHGGRQCYTQGGFGLKWQQPWCCPAVIVGRGWTLHISGRYCVNRGLLRASFQLRGGSGPTKREDGATVDEKSAMKPAAESRPWCEKMVLRLKSLFLQAMKWTMRRWRRRAPSRRDYTDVTDWLYPLCPPDQPHQKSLLISTHAAIRVFQSMTNWVRAPWLRSKQLCLDSVTRHNLNQHLHPLLGSLPIDPPKVAFASRCCGRSQHIHQWVVDIISWWLIWPK